MEGANEDEVVMLGVPDQAFSFDKDVNSEVRVSLACPYGYKK